MDMMELSVFLAKVFGLYLLVISVDMLFRKKELDKAIKDLAHSRGLVVCCGSLSLFIGLIVAIAHPVWTRDWRGLITLIGYVLIARGVARIFFPSHFKKTMHNLFTKGYWILFLVFVVVGIYLTYMGFNAMNMMNNNMSAALPAVIPAA